MANKGNAPHSYRTAPIHATSAVSGIGAYTYDNNGNRSTDPSGLAFNYDGENHLLSLTSGPTTVFQNVYDGEGTRVVRYDQSAQTTHFVGEWYEDNVTTGIATAYYPFNGRPIAMTQGSTLSYLHHDHLGSLVAASESSGAEVGGAAWARYSHFGQLRLGASAGLLSDRLFTGQTRDNVLGAGNVGNDAYYFFQARYCDAMIGQFQSADTVTATPARPRGLNRYAYASNNPLTLRDSTGHASEMPVEMLPAGPLVNVAAAQQHQPLVNITPPTVLGGALVYTGGLNLGPNNITTQPVLGTSNPLVQNAWHVESLLAAAIHIGKPFKPSASREDLSALAFGRLVHKGYALLADTDALTEKAIRNALENVVRDEDGRYGRPDQQYPKKNQIRDLKPVPSSISPGEEESYLVQAYDTQMRRYEDLWRRAHDNIEPDVYIDYYRAPEQSTPESGTNNSPGGQ